MRASQLISASERLTGPVQLVDGANPSMGWWGASASEQGCDGCSLFPADADLQTRDVAALAAYPPDGKRTSPRSSMVQIVLVPNPSSPRIHSRASGWRLCLIRFSGRLRCVDLLRSGLSHFGRSRGPMFDRVRRGLYPGGGCVAVAKPCGGQADSEGMTAREGPGDQRG
jgi:hypothetical protein